jgi:hypothetical protein
LASAKKNAARQGRLIVFIDESGVSERPTRARTWAVKGETPVVQFHFNWHQLSLIAGMHFTGMCFRLHDGSIAKEQVVEFLKALLAHLRRPLLIVWDSSRPHRSHLVRDYVASTENSIQLHFLPGYAPELNPVESSGPGSSGMRWPTSVPTHSTSYNTPPVASSNPRSAAALLLPRAGSRLLCSDVTRLRKPQ